MAYADPEDSRRYQAAYRASHREEKRVYNAAYRVAHHEELLDQQRAKQAAYGEWMRLLTATWPCEVCGAVAQLWHHLNPSTKKFNLGGEGHTLDAIEAELDKCIPVCYTCHMSFNTKPRNQKTFLEEE